MLHMDDLSEQPEGGVIPDLEESETSSKTLTELAGSLLEDYLHQVRRSGTGSTRIASSKGSCWDIYVDVMLQTFFSAQVRGCGIGSYFS